jgi:hypothetical protein
VAFRAEASPPPPQVDPFVLNLSIHVNFKLATKLIFPDDIYSLGHNDPKPSFKNIIVQFFYFKPLSAADAPTAASSATLPAQMLRPSAFNIKK